MYDKQRIFFRGQCANFKEIDMGMSSLAFDDISLWDLSKKFENKRGGGFASDDGNWFLREMKKNAESLSRPATVINFDYLENN